MTAIEFQELLSMLENNGLITFKASKIMKESVASKTVQLNVQAEDIVRACSESVLLSRVLQTGEVALKK